MHRRDFVRTMLTAAGGTWALSTPPSQLPAWAAESSTKEKHVPWLAEVQTLPQTLPETTTQLPAVLIDDNGQPITSIAAWEQKRKVLRQRWLDFLHPLETPRIVPKKLTVLEEDRVGEVLRQRVQYAAEPGLLTEGYLLRPLHVEGPLPGLVVFHSTVDHSIRQPAGVEGVPEKAFGLKFARKGYITFSPRNFLWPTNDKIETGIAMDRFSARHPESKGMAKMLFDSQLAVDILAAQPGVDRSRLGAVGHSLGAKEVLYLAAFDDRIKATVSSEGGVGTKFSNWDAPWYLGKTIQQSLPAGEHHLLLAMAAPRPFLLIGGDSADGDQSWPFIEQALPAYELYGRPARLGLLNHKRGHAVPPLAEQRIEEWFDTYL